MNVANVSCNTINDLLPLYLDDALSEDSKTLVREHLDGCAACGAVYHKLTETKLPLQQGKAEADKRAFKGIRRKLLRKKLLTACISAGLVLILTFGLYWFFAGMDFYVPYEKSGLFMDGNVIKTENDYHCAHFGCSPDGSIAFIYLTATKMDAGRKLDAYTYNYPDSSSKEVITEQTIFSMDELDPTVEIDEQGNVVQVFDRPTALYYVAQEYAEQLPDYWLVHPGDDQSEVEKLQNLIENSTLIWKAE